MNKLDSQVCLQIADAVESKKRFFAITSTFPDTVNAENFFHTVTNVANDNEKTKIISTSIACQDTNIICVATLAVKQ